MWLEYIAKRTGRTKKVIEKRGKFYTFEPGPIFGDKWVCNVEDEAVAKIFLQSNSIVKIREGIALKTDPDMIQLILENQDVIREIMDSEKAYRAEYVPDVEERVPVAAPAEAVAAPTEVVEEVDSEWETPPLTEPLPSDDDLPFPTAEVPDDYESKHISTLRHIASEKGLTIVPKNTKVEIIAQLRAIA